MGGQPLDGLAKRGIQISQPARTCKSHESRHLAHEIPRIALKRPMSQSVAPGSTGETIEKGMNPDKGGAFVMRDMKKAQDGQEKGHRQLGGRFCLRSVGDSFM